MVNARKSASQALKLVRKHARQHGYLVKQLSKRGKGSHTMWIVTDTNGSEIARFGLTGHSGEMSWTVTRSTEQALEPIFGQGWMDK